MILLGTRQMERVAEKVSRFTKKDSTIKRLKSVRMINDINFLNFSIIRAFNQKCSN